MANAQKAGASNENAVYEVRALTNRWVQPTVGTVISSHRSAAAAWAAFRKEPQESTDGTGRTTAGNFQPKAVVRVDAQGKESIVVPPPAGGGLLAWPYEN